MKIYKTLLAGILGAASLASCVNEMPFEGNQSKKNQGQMELNVDLLKPQTRTVTEVKNFPVTIFDAEGKEIKSFSAVSEITSPITMEVGNYIVESHTPGQIQKKMYEPYYKGQQEVEILKGITSKAEVICKMENSIINIVYDDEFKNTFSTWQITLDDGSDTALGFTNTNAINSVYWYFGENGTEKLNVNFQGTTKDGSNISAKYQLTKDQADESYDDDRENFCGGDALNLKFTATEATDGKLTEVIINADVTFTETNENVTVNVIDVPGNFEDNPGEGGGDNPGGDNPGGDNPGGDQGITLTLPQDMAVNESTDVSLGDVLIEAPAGIKSIQVTVSSTNAFMMESLKAVGAQYGIDFVNGTEVVGNQNLVTLFIGLEKDLSVPAEGDKSYIFPIGYFFELLVVFPGKDTFNLTVTDMNGNTKSGSLTLTAE